MIDFKPGGKYFADAPNSAKLKSDGLHRMSAAEKKAAFGGEANLGDHLNKIADPNFINPANKVEGAGNNELGKDAFMKLMLEQMKHQDPTSPLKSHEMAAQLAQFTSLEQLFNINNSIEGLKETQEPVANFQALNFIGKVIQGDSAKIIRATGDKKHSIAFDLKQDASDVEVKILDRNNEIVKKMDAGEFKKGNNEIEWNGLAENNLPSIGGEYRVMIEAKNKQGKKVAVETQFSGKITGVNFTADGAVLMIGNKTVRLSDVKKISEPEVQKENINNKNIIQRAGSENKGSDIEKTKSNEDLKGKKLARTAN